MSHEFESGFVVGQPAWHRLATVLTEVPTLAEGIIKAGLDWEVLRLPLIALNKEEAGLSGISCAGWQAIVRKTDERVLGIASDKYVPLQNREAFNWFQPFLDKSDCQLESAGSLKQGRIVWVLAKILAGGAEVTDGDKLEAYLLLSNAHDGTRAVTVGFTPIRVVCWNTASAAHRGLDRAADKKTGKALRIVHTKAIKANLEAVQKTVDIAARRLEDLVADARVLRGREIDATSFYQFLEKVYGPERDAIRAKLQSCYETAKDESLSPEAREIAKEGAIKLEEKLARPFRKVSTIERITKLFNEGPGADLAGKTLWGAVNAVTRYEEYERKGTPENNLHASWFGGSVNEIRERAYDTAASML